MSKEIAKFPLRMDIDTANMVRAIYRNDNCNSQNEFIEKAINFYISYITTNHYTSFLNPMLNRAINATLKDNENRMANNLFRLTVEMSMMMYILAQGLEVTDDSLRVLRARCIKEVKATKGKINFEKTVTSDD